MLSDFSNSSSKIGTASTQLSDIEDARTWPLLLNTLTELSQSEAPSQVFRCNAPWVNNQPQSEIIV